ncbi:MAG TPA: sialidase family protein [Candidatus Eremiobacteraceae bacterium]
MHRHFIAAFLAIITWYAAGSVASAQPALVKVSADRFTTSGFQHKTEVEPQTYAYGNTIIGTFQVGRVGTQGVGSEDIGWSTSLNGGSTWQHGVLPGITKGQNPNNKYDGVSDPSVAYDAAHGVWMISSLPLSNTLPSSPAVLISRSTDALHWRHPVGIAPRTQSADKNWITCDDTSTSPFYGHCYVEWDEPAGGDLIMMSTSTDGGATWSSPRTTANGDSGLGGEPLVQPNGTVIVPLWGGSGIISFESTNGGMSWNGAVNVAQIFWNGDPGGIRSNPLPSTSMDASGTIYVAWSDCRFRTNCSSNDIVYASSADGVNWSSVSRVPIDPTSSSDDHLDPGFGVQPTTSGSSANIGVTFYFFPNVNCSFTTCQLGVGFVSSANGGQTWNSASTLAGPMHLSWLATSDIGYMVGDYITTAFVNAKAFSIVAVAKPPVGGLFDQAMYAPMGGLAVPRFAPQFTSMFDVAHPDYRFLFHWHRIPPKGAKAEHEG